MHQTKLAHELIYINTYAYICVFVLPIYETMRLLI